MSWRPPDTSTAGTAPPLDRGRRRLAVVAVAIVVVVVVATLSVYEVTRPGPSSSVRATAPYPPPPVGWATFDTAWANVSRAFAGFADGNWTVGFVEGAAADGPWSPPAVLWTEVDPLTWAECASQLSGVSTLTFWNASLYPFSNSADVFSSGAAPLWTFIFNGTGTSTFVATWLTGTVILNGVLGPASPCFGVSPPMNEVFQGASFDPVQPSVELDSNVIASAAIAEQHNASFSHVAPVPVPPTPAFALYFPGPQSVPITIEAPDTWVVTYGQCGMAGQLGSGFTLTDYVFSGLSAAGNLWASLDLTCADSYFTLNMTNSTVTNPPSSSGVYRGWNLTSEFLTSAVPAVWTASDLATTMLQWEVLGGASGNPPIASAAALCGSSSINFSSCVPPSSGWYAVLLSPNGTWLDSYPSAANGTAWTIPWVHVADGDRIDFVGSPGFPTSAYFRTIFDTEPTVYAGASLGPSG
jgi:hypothetical protein